MSPRSCRRRRPASDVPIALIVLGFGLVGAGIFFAVGGLGNASAVGSATKNITLQGPSWLILVALGVGTIVFGAWQFEEKGTTAAPPKEEETVVTVPEGQDEPYSYGDDPDLDNLWDSCFEGDWSDCDELYLQAPFDSEYEWFGGTCGALIGFDELFCTEVPVEELEEAQDHGFGKPAMQQIPPAQTTLAAND